MNSSQHIPGRSFWVVTTIAIIFTCSFVVFQGAGPGNGGGTSANLWLTIGLPFIPGICLGILQAFMLEHSSIGTRVKWFVITVVSVAIGWYAVLTLMIALFGKPVSIDNTLRAAFYGFLLSALIGVIVGSVSGLFQAYLHYLPVHKWIINNVVCWGLGIAIPLVTILVIVSLITIPIF